MDTAHDENWYSDDAATFGDRVAAARELLGMSDDELAKRLGVRLKTIQGWENDVSEPRANKLQMLSGVLNVSMPWLLTGEGQTFVKEEPSAQEVSDLMTEIRALRGEMLTTAERLGVLEKRLKKIAA